MFVFPLSVRFFVFQLFSVFYKFRNFSCNFNSLVLFKSWEKKIQEHLLGPEASESQMAFRREATEPLSLSPL